MFLPSDCSATSLVNALLCVILLSSVQKKIDLLFSSSTEGRRHEPETYLIVSAQITCLPASQIEADV